jgi:hypothetical protein
VILPREPFEEGLQGRQGGVLADEGERRAVRLAVIEQVALIALQDRLGDLARIGEAALVAPGDEPADRDAAGASPTASLS